MQITVYTIKDCPFCKEEKDYLTTHNLPFTEKNVEEKKEYLEEMLKLSDNFAGVPFTEVVKDDGTKMGLKGFTKDEFDEGLGFVEKAVTQPQAVSTVPGVQPVAPSPVPPVGVFPVPTAPAVDNTTVGGQVSQPPFATSNVATASSGQVPSASSGQGNPMDALLNNLQSMSQGNASTNQPAVPPVQEPVVPQEPVTPVETPVVDVPPVPEVPQEPVSPVEPVQPLVETPSESQQPAVQTPPSVPADMPPIPDFPTK